MKTLYRIGFLLLALNLTPLLQPQTTTAQLSVSFQVFYDNLSPYGNWIQNPNYGYVWVPRVSAGFSPYHTNGYWVYTEMGWTWASDYAWGWAPFHYGRWYYDPYYGWIWVPDSEWGPAWVCWRSSPNYYGWAPMGPGVSIQLAYSSGYHVPNNHWTFVRNRDFGRTNINNYYVTNTRNTTIVKNTTIINTIREDKGRNVRYAMGPDRMEVQKKTGKNLNPITIKDRNAPGQIKNNREMELFRPEVKKENASKPALITDSKELKRQPQKTSETNSIRNKNNTSNKPQAVPQREQRETAPKIAPTKPDKPQREVTNPRQEMPSRPQPQNNPPGRNKQMAPQQPQQPQQPRMNREGAPQQPQQPQQPRMNREKAQQQPQQPQQPRINRETVPQQPRQQMNREVVPHQQQMNRPDTHQNLPVGKVVI